MIKSGLTFSLPAVLIAAALLFTTCKKEEPVPDEDGQSSTDNRDVLGENDAAISEINDVIGEHASLRGKISGESFEYNEHGVSGTVCGLTVDTNGLYLGTITLNYDGTTCNNRTRTGSIKLTVQDFSNGKRWKDAGCIVEVEFQNYKVTRASDQRSIQLAGKQYLTNELGGTWVALVLNFQSSLVHSVKGTNLKATFKDNKTANYNINRRFTYTYPDKILTCKGEGTGSLNGLNNLENYGTTRDGDNFTSQVFSPIIWNLTCGPWAPVSGGVRVKVESKESELICTFGVDNTGQPVTVAKNNCPYGWKLEWTVKKKTSSKVFGYN